MICIHFTQTQSTKWGLMLFKELRSGSFIKFYFQPKREPLRKIPSLMKFDSLILLFPFKSFNKVVVITNICPTETFPLWKPAKCSQADFYSAILYKHTQCNPWHSTKGHSEVLCHDELITKNWQGNSTWQFFLFQEIPSAEQWERVQTNPSKMTM